MSEFTLTRGVYTSWAPRSPGPRENVTMSGPRMYSRIEIRSGKCSSEEKDWQLFHTKMSTFGLEQ